MHTSQIPKQTTKMLFSSLPTLLLLPLALATNTSYPSKDTISNIFSNLAGDHPHPLKFFSHVSPSVNWTIEGTHPAAGVYTNRSVLEATFARIAATGSEAHPLRVSVINIIGGADEEWSVEELQVYGVCRNGMSLLLPFFFFLYPHCTIHKKILYCLILMMKC